MYSPRKNMVDTSAVFEVLFQSFKFRNNKYGVATTVISEIAWILVVYGSVMRREGEFFVLCFHFVRSEASRSLLEGYCDKVVPSDFYLTL